MKNIRMSNWVLCGVIALNVWGAFGCNDRASFLGLKTRYQDLLTPGSEVTLFGLPSGTSNFAQIAFQARSPKSDEFRFALLNEVSECTDVNLLPPSPTNLPINTDLGPDGPKTLCAIATKYGYTMQLKPTIYTWTKDTIAPGEFGLVHPVQKIQDKDSVELTWTAAEGAGEYLVSVSLTADCGMSAQSATVKSLQSAVKLVEGINFICLSAFDAAGNAREANGSPFVVNVDRTSPNVFAIHSPQKLSNNSNPTFAWGRAAGAHEYRVQVSKSAGCEAASLEQTTQNLSLPFESALEDGVYQLCVTAQDLAGNSRVAVNSSYSFEIDTVAPLLMFDGATLPQNPSNAKQIKARVDTSSQDLQRFRYALGSGEIDCKDIANFGDETPVSSIIDADISAVEDGLVKLCAFGGDAAGNWMVPSEGSYAEYHWLKDTEKPTIQLELSEVCGPKNCDAAGMLKVGETSVSDTLTGIAKVEITLSGPNGKCWSQASGLFDSDCPNYETVDVQAGKYSVPVALSSLVVSGNYTLSARATDVAGNAATVARTFVWDAVSPDVSTFTLIGKPTTSSPFVKAQISAIDTLSNISAICVRSLNSSEPMAADSCWLPPAVLGKPMAKTFASENVPVTLGFLGPLTYQVHAWVKDAAGNVSMIKTDAVNYAPGVVPELTDVVATSTDQPLSPPSFADRTVVPGNPLIVKWIARDPDKSLPAAPISIWYTTNEFTWTELATNIENRANGTCSIPAVVATDRLKSGCYVWPNPLSGYLKIRVAVKDSDGQVAFSTAPPLNLPNVNFLAGNTELGIGASARATIFQNDMETAAFTDSHSLVVTNNGEIVFRDYRRGIYRVRRETGVLELVMPADAGFDVDDVNEVPLSMSRLIKPLAIAKDFQDRILVLDQVLSDRASLRLIDLEKQTVRTLLKPDQIAITGGFRRTRMLFATPNGNVYLWAKNNNGKDINPYIAVYNMTNGSLATITLDGNVTLPNMATNFNVNKCKLRGPGLSYDVTTNELKIGLLTAEGYSDGSYPDCVTTRTIETRMIGMDPKLSGSSLRLDTNLNVSPMGAGQTVWGEFVTGMNGRLFYVDRDSATISQFDPATNQLLRKIGTGTNGQCVDQTPALECAIDPSDVFVAADGRIYFTDRGRVRAIYDDGGISKVVTVVGQSYAFGDEGNPISARFGLVNRFGTWVDAQAKRRFVVLDAMERRIREFIPGDKIMSIAGNGTDKDSALPAVAAASMDSISVDYSGLYADDIGVHPTNGSVFYRTNGAYMMLDRGTGRWRNFAGFGAKSWFNGNAEGAIGTEVSFQKSTALRILGASPTKLLAVTGRYPYNEGYSNRDAFRDSQIFELDFDTGRFTKKAGSIGRSALTDAEICDGGKESATVIGNAKECSIMHTYQGNRYSGAQPMTTASGSSWLYGHTNSQVIYHLDTDGKLKIFANLQYKSNAFAYRPASGSGSDTGRIYYCDTAGNLRLHVLNAVPAVDAKLSIGPGNAAKCAGREMHWQNGRLFFVYSLNHMQGIAEYVD